MTFNTALVAASREKFRFTPEYMTEELASIRHGLKLAVSHSASTWLASTDYGMVNENMKKRFPRGIRRALRRVLELEAGEGDGADDEEVELSRPLVLANQSGEDQIDGESRSEAPQALLAGTGESSEPHRGQSQNLHEDCGATRETSQE